MLYWGTGGVCVDREVPDSAIVSGSASFTAKVPVAFCDPNTQPVMLPSDLNDLLNQLNNLNLTAPGALNELLRMQQQLADLNAQLGTQGFSTQSFQILANGDNAEKQRQKLMQKREALLLEIQAAQHSLQTAMQPLDTQLTDLKNLVASHYDYLLHRYEGIYRPLSLEQYKQKFDGAENFFYRMTHTRNMQDMLMAGFVPVLETQLYRMLLNDIRQGTVPVTDTSDLTGHEYSFEQIHTVMETKPLVNLLSRRIQNHRTRLGKLQTAMQHKLDKLIARSARRNGLTQADIQELNDMTELQTEEAPDEFEMGFASTQSGGGFTVQYLQAPGPTEIDPGNGSGGIGGAGAPVFTPGTPGPGGGFKQLFAGPAAALGLAIGAFRDQILSIFNNGFRWLCEQTQPSPSPQPTLIFPSPSPSPTPPNKCGEGGLPLEDLKKEGRLQPGKNPKPNGNKLPLIFLMDADLDKAKNDFERLIGPDCVPDNKDKR